MKTVVVFTRPDGSVFSTRQVPRAYAIASGRLRPAEPRLWERQIQKIAEHLEILNSANSEGAVSGCWEVLTGTGSSTGEHSGLNSKIAGGAAFSIATIPDVTPMIEPPDTYDDPFILRSVLRSAREFGGKRTLRFSAAWMSGSQFIRAGLD